MKKKLTTIILLLLASFSLVYGDIGDWTTYTNKGDIRDIGIYQNVIWCATNGGIFKYNIEDSTYEEFTNTTGLASNDVTTLEIDEFGNIWFGMSNGYINVYWADTKTWDTIDDIVEYEEHYIYDFKLYGDSLFVALDIGISLYHLIYDKSRREVKETYKNLGEGFQVEIPVKCIHLNGKDIWAGTDFGVAKSNLDISNLQAPESWTNYTVANSNIQGNIIRSISSLNNSVFILTERGVFSFDGSNWTKATAGLSVSDTTDVNVLYQKDGKLYLGARFGLYSFDSNQWSKVGYSASYVSSITVGQNGDLWAGRQKIYAIEGFIHYDPQKRDWDMFIPPGPGSNNFKALAIDHEGVLWCCSTTDGILRYDGISWKAYRSWDYGFNNNVFWAVTVDNLNRKWFGSWGSGVIQIDENDNLSFHNEAISGTSDPHYYVVINSTIDKDGNVWFLNSEAGNGNVVAVVSPDGRWQHFSTSEGIITSNTREIFGIAVDQYNRIWVGSLSGITVIDFNNTLFDKYDDDLSGTLTTSDGLVNNNVRTMVEDYDGIMWLGTNEGLNYWFTGEVYDKSGVIHDNIETIAVDIRNNKWFGTIAGVSVLEPDNYTWLHYTTDNSPLVSSHVTCFAFDENTGRVYIGTTNGLSCLETPYSKPQINLDNVTAGPNPFLIKDNSKFLLLKLSENVSIKFLTTDGMLVRNVLADDILGSVYEWDGRNDDGDPVSSGIYLYLIYNEETGISKVGKFAVVR